ncbi:hypothetical protein RQP46_008364 [Phenoliferia psychrophenolica]
MAAVQQRKGCFKCGEINHIAEQCSSPARLCFNCKEEGHESNACPQERNPGTKQCYSCGGVGHLQAECPSLRVGGFLNGGTKCYACGQFGHIARTCPTAGPAVVAVDGEQAPVGTAAPVRAPGFVGPPRGGFAGRGFPPRGGFVGGYGGRGAFVGGPPRVVRCYKCGELNHLARSCTAAGIPAFVATVGVNTRPKTCYKCQEEGHIARECPTNEPVTVVLVRLSYFSVLFPQPIATSEELVIHTRGICSDTGETGRMDVYALSLEEEARAQLCRRPPVASPVLRDVCLLELIFAQLPLETILSVAQVNYVWHDAALRELYHDVRLDTPLSAERFAALLATSDVGRRVRGFHITKSTFGMLEGLPALLPNLAALTLTPIVHLTTADLVKLLHSWRLRSLTIVGQDVRTLRTRRESTEPEGEVGKALRQIADSTEPGSLRHLRSLKILATPLKVSTLDYFLERWGEGLDVLEVESCGIGDGLSALVEAWCPNLRVARLDLLCAANAPTRTPRPEAEAAAAPPLSLLPQLALSTALTSLHFSSLPDIDPSHFSLFSSPAHAALKSLSISHSDLGAAHLSHFAHITRLRLVGCKNVKSIPVFLAKGRTDVGPGCQELRQISLLGCRGLTLRNLWELCMLGREELSFEEEKKRKRMGLGQRGLKKITVDGAQGSDAFAPLFHLALPPDFGEPVDPITVEGSLPAGLLPPPHLLPFLATNLLSPSLSTPALLQTLVIAQDLEEVGLFGTLGNSSARRRVATPPPTFWAKSLAYARQLPIVGPYILALTTSTPAPLPPYPFPNFVPFPRNPSVEGATKALPILPWPAPDIATAEMGKRLSTAEVNWLLVNTAGKLRKVFV